MFGLNKGRYHCDRKVFTLFLVDFASENVNQLFIGNRCL